MRGIRAVRTVVAIVLLVLLVASGSGALSPSPPSGPPSSPPSSAPAAQPNAHRQLRAMSTEYANNGRVDERARRDQGIPVSGGSVTIAAVPVRTGAELLADLRSLGLSSGAAFPNLVTGRLPVSSIEDARELDSLQYMRPDWVTPAVGKVTSQGDAAMKSDDARAAFSVNGSGIKIGTLSDSFNCKNGANADVTSGDLPSGVQVLQEGACSGATDEGRAMMQIVHDVAPGSTQAFHTAFAGQANFAQGIIDLKNAGARVINDDISYFAEPFFQDGVIAQAIDTVNAAGVTYFSAAGNAGRRSYESPFRDTGVAGRVGTMHDFDPGPGVDTRQRISIAPHSQMNLFLQWDDPFGTHAPSTAGPASNIEIFAFAPPTSFSSGTLITSSQDNNATTQEPVEDLFINNFGSAPKLVDLQIERRSGPVPGVVKWVDFGEGASAIDFATNSGTSVGHANAAGALATGAAFFGQTPDFGVTPPVLEPFSSAGGTSVLFGTNGVRLGSPSTRQTPDLTAPDGVNTTFFFQDTPADADTFPNFFGTSAAAPHGAGVAALALSKVTNATPSDVCNALAQTAVNIGPAGFDADSGFGLINAHAALGLLTAPGLSGPCGTGPPPPPPPGPPALRERRERDGGQRRDHVRDLHGVARALVGADRERELRDGSRDSVRGIRLRHDVRVRHLRPDGYHRDDLRPRHRRHRCRTQRDLHRGTVRCDRMRRSRTGAAPARSRTTTRHHHHHRRRANSPWTTFR